MENQKYDIIIRKLFSMYNNRLIGFDTMESILESIEAQEQSLHREFILISFKFGDNPLVYTMKDLIDGVYGYNKENRILLWELIEGIEKNDDDDYLKIEFR